MEKNLSRLYKVGLEDDLYIEPIIDFVKKFNVANDNDKKIFITFRTAPERISFYYKGREAFCLLPEYDEKTRKNIWYIRFRNYSSSKNMKYLKINSEYSTKLCEANISAGQKVKINLADLEKYKILIRATIDFLNAYYIDDEEKTIQNKIACRYQGWEENSNGDKLLCLDQEYNQSFISTNAKEESDITGRYDLIMLKKENDTKYKLLFVELKSDIGACTDYISGIINHISDMEAFLDSYKKDLFGSKTIMMNGILFAIERKEHFGFIPEDIGKYINFENPEFWLLFDLVKDAKIHLPKNKMDVESLIDAEINKAKRTNSIIARNKIRKNIIMNTCIKSDLNLYPSTLKKIKGIATENSYYNNDNNSEFFIKI